MYFNTRAAKELQPGQHLLVDGCPGLRLVAVGTKKTWTYRYKNAAGKMKQVALGEWGALDFQKAAARYNDLKDLRATGVDPVEHKKQSKAEARERKPVVYTVRAVVADYLAGHVYVERSAASAKAARSALERLLAEEPAFADSAAKDVDRGVAFTVLDARKSTPTAAAKLRSLLGAAWSYAHDAGRLDGSVPNWWREVMRGRLKSKGKIIGGEHVGRKRRNLSGPEVGLLLGWLPNMHAIGQDATWLYLATGMRGVEIFGMRPEHIGAEADGWWLTLPKELTKNERFADAVDHRVPLVGRTLEIVRRRMTAVGASGYLFETVRAGGAKQYSQHFFSTYVYSLQPYSEKVRRRAGAGLVCPVTHWTPHNLRRTARTALAMLGCPDEVGEAVLGHMPDVMVATYNSHTYDAEKRRWLVILAEWLEHQAGLPALP